MSWTGQRLTKAQRRATLLMWAYLHHHARPEYRSTGWMYLLLWAELGGRTRDVPKEFGGTA